MKDQFTKFSINRRDFLRSIGVGATCCPMGAANGGRASPTAIPDPVRLKPRGNTGNQDDMSLYCSGKRRNFIDRAVG